MGRRGDGAPTVARVWEAAHRAGRLAAQARGRSDLPDRVHPDLPDAAGYLRLVRRPGGSPGSGGGSGRRAGHPVAAGRIRPDSGAEATGGYGVRLSDAWMIFVFLAFAMYIVLDGYDLGIGVLTLFERDDRRRREMHELVSWVWDGNESWIVLVALTLWAGVPLVIGVALPALYLVLIPMLWSLIARGVSLELIDQHEGWHPVWGRLFGVGTL